MSELLPTQNHGLIESRYPKRWQVLEVNSRKLGKIKTPEYRFDAFDHGGLNGRGRRLNLAEAKKRLDNDTVWPDKIGLKVGAFVMLVTVRSFGGGTKRR